MAELLTSVPTLSKAPANRVRVFLVDDHELVRYGTARLIESEPDLAVCGESAGAPAAMKLLPSADPDVAIIDLTLQEGTGLDLVREIKQLYPHIRMIVCSMHDETLYALRVLRAGAQGYVNKQEAPRKLVAAIRKVLSGELFLSQQLTQDVLERTAGTADRDAPTPQQGLSDRELQVYELIGESLTVREIAERLRISPKTVDFHRDRLRKKLELPSNRALSRHALLWLREESQRASEFEQTRD